MTKYKELQQRLKAEQYVWLVTGAAGFIGSNLVEKLLALGQKVVGMDNFETGYQHNLDQALEDAGKALASNGSTFQANNFTFIKGDVREIKDCQNACQGVDYVLHQAALGSVPRSIENPIATNKANIDGFLNMLVASKDAGVKRFVYAASSSTYGDHPDLPKVESRIGNPLSPYAVTKLVNELYAGVFARTYGIKTIGLRYFNIFGKRQDPNGAYAAVIPKWVASIINGKDVFINGDGETSRDFCYIDNAVQINLLAAMAKNEVAFDQIYNVAVGERTSLKELYEMIAKELAPLGHAPQKELQYRNFRPGDVRHSLADISKAQELLDYDPSHTITKGMKEAMSWYTKNLGS